MIACIRAPAAVTIAVSYWESTWASWATVPWIPLIEPVSRHSRIAETAEPYPRFMFSATSASAFSCAYCLVRLRSAVWRSACSFASRPSSIRRLWKSSWSFWRLFPDSFVDELSSLSCHSASSCSTAYCFRDSSSSPISDSTRAIASFVRSPSRTKPLSFSSTWSISLFRAMICFWMLRTFASLFDATSSTSWRSLSAPLICSSSSPTRLSTFPRSRASASVSFWTLAFSLLASAASVRICFSVSFDVSIPSVARARSIRRPSSFSLSCFASSPPRSAISCSSSFSRATAASRRPRSSSFWASNFALSPSCFAICSLVPTICRSINSRFLYASWAFAVVSFSFRSRYFRAPSRSASSCLICLSISSRMIRIRSRLSSVSLRFPSAWPMSSSNFVMPAMLSRIRRRSTEDMETIRWMSPCWTRL